MATLSPLTATSPVDGVDAPSTTPHFTVDERLDATAQAALERLEKNFQQPFTVLDGDSGTILHAAEDGLDCDYAARLALCRHVAETGRPEFIEVEPPLATLAVPLLPLRQVETPLLALATFVTDRVTGRADLGAAAKSFGLDTAGAWQWATSRDVWPTHAVLRLAEALCEAASSRKKNEQLHAHVSDVSTQLLNTFEEITLLHRLTQHLSLSGNFRGLCELTATWLADVVPAECIVVKLALADERPAELKSDQPAMVITHGDCPLAATEFDNLIARLGPSAHLQSVVMNQPATGAAGWPFADVHELVSVPIREGHRFFGWLLALNHSGQRTRSVAEDSFGTVEASLMSSVAVILGIHSGNIELYREQADFFASAVRALTSAIDAKDHYTRGHSERVAHIAVCLAQQLGCPAEQLNTLYLSGLLHDIGKIGIDTNILRKPGALTDEEFEHVKKHPEMGYQILKEVKQLDDVLPVVLHHHEAWDGSGYPSGLKGEECPLTARIAAVADSIDAMSSDRPYRRGIPNEKLDRILRDGAGKQWDARIIDAVFQAREKIRQICRLNRDERALDVAHWQD